LENDWNVRGVEKSDWVSLFESSHLLAAQLEFNSEALEVDDDKDNNDGGDEVQKIWCILSIESLLQAIHLVWFSEHEVEEGNDGTFEFGSLVSSDGDWGEGFPEDGLADIGGNEE
jgi:hypothetical protein